MRRQEKNRSRVILGIDPGSLVCGYGIIRAEFRRVLQVAQACPKHPALSSTVQSDCSYVASGRIVLSSRSPLNVRLKELYDAVVEIIREYSPNEIAVEKVFFAKSAKAALTLGQAKGAVLIAAATCSIPVYEYSALETKKAIVGYGRAEKHQVQGMVSRMLNVKSNLSGDSADALAIAICHTNTLIINE